MGFNSAFKGLKLGGLQWYFGVIDIRAYLGYRTTARQLLGMSLYFPSYQHDVRVKTYD